MTFTHYIKKKIEKALKISTLLARLLHNVKGSQGKKRKIYSRVAHSPLLYVGKIWTNAAAEKATSRN